MSDLLTFMVKINLAATVWTKQKGDGDSGTLGYCYNIPESLLGQ